MRRDTTEYSTGEKRSEPRRAKLRNYRIEIKFVGKPIYQFRVINVTTKGAGLLIKYDSAFLKMIEVGQIVEADFISPEALLHLDYTKLRSNISRSSIIKTTRDID